MTAYELDHLAVATADWEASAHMLVRELGGVFKMGAHMPLFATCQFAVHDDMRIELMKPGAADAFVARFVHENSGRPKPHHLTFKVANLEATMSAAENAGFEPILVNKDNEYWREFFLHPRVTGLGILVQCVETPRGEIMPNQSASHTILNSWEEPTIAPRAVPSLYCEVAELDTPLRMLQEVLGARVTASHEGRYGISRVLKWQDGAELVVTQVEEMTRSAGVIALSTQDAGASACSALVALDHIAHSSYSPALGVRIVELDELPSLETLSCANAVEEHSINAEHGMNRSTHGSQG